MLNSPFLHQYQQQGFRNAGAGSQGNTVEPVPDLQHFSSILEPVRKIRAENLEYSKRSITNAEFVPSPKSQIGHSIHEMHEDLQNNSPSLIASNCSSPVDSSSFQNHIQVENAILTSNDRNFSCQKCNKVFKRGDHLKRHLLSVHDHDNPYHCGECRKGFITVDCLIKHTHTAHNGTIVKACVCTWCGLQFDDVLELDKHATSVHKKQDMEYIREINKSSRIFSCVMCNKTVSSEKTLQRHIKKAHRRADGKQLCLECNASFYSVRELQAHIDQFHDGCVMSIADDEIHSSADTSSPTSVSKNVSSRKQKGPRTEGSQSTRPKYSNSLPVKMSQQNHSLLNGVSSQQNHHFGSFENSHPTHLSEQNLSFNQQNRQVKLLPQELEMHVQRVCSDEYTSSSSICPRPLIRSQFVKPSGAKLFAQNQSLPFCTQDAKINSTSNLQRNCTKKNAEQTNGEAVSEVFSKAMRTLSDYSYEGLFLQTT